jgi:hypothetical protein
MDGIGEEFVQQEVGEGRVFVKSLFDVTKEDTADDAASSPHVQFPVKLPRSLTH